LTGENPSIGHALWRLVIIQRRGTLTGDKVGTQWILSQRGGMRAGVRERKVERR